MAADPFTAALNVGNSIIERLWPDPAIQSKEKLKLAEMAQSGDLERLNAQVQLMIAQIKVNEEQAKSKSVFVAGARPFIIWVGGFSMAWSGLIHPLLTWVWAFMEMTGSPPPLIEAGALTAIVTGLLGVGGMRSFDKKQGTQTDKI